jgi:hypothetical protein
VFGIREGCDVTAEHRVFGVPLEIYFTDVLTVVLLRYLAECD